MTAKTTDRGGSYSPLRNRLAWRSSHFAIAARHAAVLTGQSTLATAENRRGTSLSPLGLAWPSDFLARADSIFDTEPMTHPYAYTHWLRGSERHPNQTGPRKGDAQASGAYLPGLGRQSGGGSNVRSFVDLTRTVRAMIDRASLGKSRLARFKPASRPVRVDKGADVEFFQTTDCAVTRDIRPQGHPNFFTRPAFVRHMPRRKQHLRVRPIFRGNHLCGAEIFAIEIAQALASAGSSKNQLSSKVRDRSRAAARMRDICSASGASSPFSQRETVGCVVSASAAKAACDTPNTF